MQIISNKDNYRSATALKDNIAHAKQASELSDQHIEKRKNNRKRSMKCKPIAELMRTRSHSIQKRGMDTRTRCASQVRSSPSKLLSKRFMKKLHKSLKQYGSPSIEILATEIVRVSNLRAKDSRMITAKYSEIRYLIRRGTFKVVLR